MLRLCRAVCLLFAVGGAAASRNEDPDEVVGTCGTRGEIKALVVDILCKEPREARKTLVDKMWKCKNGALDKTMLTKELLAMASADEDRPSTCQPVADIGRGLPPSATGGGMIMGGGGGGAMTADDVPCTRESIDRIFMQILCREPTQKEAFGRMWQCKNGKLGDRKLTNMLTHFVVTGREKREGNCGPLPGGVVAPVGGGGGGVLMGPPGAGGGGGGMGVLGGGSGAISAGGGGGGGVPRPAMPLMRPAMASGDAPLPPDECPTVVFEAFKRVLCRDPNTAEKTAAVWRCRKHSESRDRVFASLAFLSRKFAVASECPGGGYGE